MLLSNNKALTEMPGPDTVGQPPVSKNPGGLEALKAIGYNRPEAHHYSMQLLSYRWVPISK